MRLPILVLSVFAAGCRQEEPATETAPAASAVTVYAGQGRDRMCISADGRAGLIAYAQMGEANCSVRGAIAEGVIKPAGDDRCRIPVSRDGERSTLGPVSEACEYYCGPGASLAGKTFVRTNRAEPVTDLAGDPLC